MQKSNLMTIITALLIVSFAPYTCLAYSGGSGTADYPYQIASATDLLELATDTGNYDKNFVLTADIDLDPNLTGNQIFTTAVIAPDTCNSSGGQIFEGVAFTGIFDGMGHKITNLTINTNGSANDFLGLFGYVVSGEIKNLGIEKFFITGANYSGIIGGLVGWNDSGNINNCYSTGLITGGDSVYLIGGLVGELSQNSNISNCYSNSIITGGPESYQIGGLVGMMEGINISNSYSIGAITSGNGASTIGGLVGENDWAKIDNCYSETVVTGDSNSEYFGGLVGGNGGDINNCYSTGTVTVKDYSSDIGGLSGVSGGNDGTISNSHSTSTVAGGNNSSGIGGLAGENVGWYGGTISYCYSTGAITGGDYSGRIGGLVGRNYAGGSINNCYSTGYVTGKDGVFEIGGLVGINDEGTVSQCYSTGNISSGSNSSDTGGLVGENSNMPHSHIDNCYSTCTVSGGDNASNLGGLAGENGLGDIFYCYAIGTIIGGSNSSNLGGLVGWKSEYGAANPFRCFFISGAPSNGLGMPLSDEQMKHQISFYGWDFVGETIYGTTDIWTIDEGIDYPKFSWQSNTPPQTGNLQVTLDPAGAIAAGAKWNVDGNTWKNSTDTVSGLSAGSHTINYKSITGWTAPPSESVTITNGLTNSISRNYTQQQQTGNLQITLGPAGAISAGAQWNVDGNTWRDSTDTVSGLPVGSHTVNYKPISGWTAPVSEQVTINDGQTTSISRNYIQNPIDSNQFGTLNGKSVKQTINGVTFTLTGGGYGSITGGANFDQITLYGTGDKSQLTISSKTETSIGDINVNGSLKGISAKNVNLRGNIDVVGSLGTLTLNDVADNHTITIGAPAIPNPKAATTFTFDRVSDLEIDSGMPIKSITATDWLVGSIDAPSIGSITTKGDKKRSIAGDLDIDVTSGTVQSIKAAGTLSGDWKCTSVKSISAAHIVETKLSLSQIPDAKILALGKLTITGWIDSSQILSQGNIGTVTAGAMINSTCFAGVAEGITGLPAAETASFPETASIKSVAIKSIKGELPPYFINSDIAAANILNASIVYPQSSNGGVPFGISANYIKKLTIKKNDGKSVSFKELNESKDSQTIDGVEIRLY
jgi:hypothetical protein